MARGGRSLCEERHSDQIDLGRPCNAPEPVQARLWESGTHPHRRVHGSLRPCSGVVGGRMGCGRTGRADRHCWQHRTCNGPSSAFRGFAWKAQNQSHDLCAEVPISVLGRSMEGGPVLRRCPHPDPEARVKVAWRVWFERYVLGVVYQTHPKGPWHALNVTGGKLKETFQSSNSAVQHLRGLFEIHKPLKPEDELQSPFLRYPQEEFPPNHGPEMIRRKRMTDGQT